jgi:hypothetical protein
MDRFGDFVGAQCFKRNKKLPVVWAQIQKQYPLFADKKFNKERLYKKLYANRCYNDSTIRSFYHQLYLLAEKFLIEERLNRNYFGYLNFLLEEFIDRSQYGLAQKTIDNFKKKRADKGYTSALYFEKYRLESNRFNFMRLSGAIHNKSTAERNLKTLNRSDEYLVVFMIAELVSDFVNAEIQLKKYNIDGKKTENFSRNILAKLNIEEILKSFPVDSEYYRILNLYYQLFKTFKEYNKLDHYYDLKEAVISCTHLLNKDEMNKMYLILINYCTDRKNHDSRNPQYKQELYGLYKTFLTEEYFVTYTSRYLTPDRYRAAMLSALEMKDFGWAETIMKKYTIKLQPIDIENMSSLAKAFYYYETNKPEQALKDSRVIKLDNFIYKYDIKNLQLKIYTDTGQHEGLYHLIRTYKEYLHNDTLLVKEGKQFYRMFIDYLEKLILFKDGKTKIDIEFELHKIHKGKDFYHRQWLVSRYKEIIKKDIKEKGNEW